MKEHYSFDDKSFTNTPSEYTGDSQDSDNTNYNFPFDVKTEEEISILLSYIQALKEDNAVKVEEFCREYLTSGMALVFNFIRNN